MLNVIILAGGKGTRMHSTKPKVLQTLAGKPLICHVLDSVAKLSAQKTVVVDGFGGELVRTQLSTQSQSNSHPVIFARQEQQLGTGHAVKIALPHLNRTGKSLILYGDVPLIFPNTLQKLIDANSTGIAMLTATVDNPFGLGRIVRQNGKVIAIAEQKDANDQEQAIKEINSGIYCIDNALLHRYLPHLTNHNAQNEYYLTDIIKMAVQDGIDISTISPTLGFEIDGVNDRKQLATLERTYQAYLVEQLQAKGVQFADPKRVDIRGTLSCGQDVFIDINTIFIGNVVLGDGVHIDANVTITNATIGKQSHIKPNCVIDDSTIGEGVSIGPFAHIRPKTVLGNHVKIGNFVEIKKSLLGTGSKVNHLSYIGDCQMGQAVNVGAGTITCNYDGVHKFTTTIGDNAFVGSNTSLVAPVVIGSGATIGAGSVITNDVPNDTLAIGRGRQTLIDNWQKPTKQ